MNPFDWLLVFLIWMAGIRLLWEVFDMAKLPSAIYPEYPELEKEE